MPKTIRSSAKTVSQSFLPGSDETTTQRGAAYGVGARLLHAIGRRGGWSLDALIEELDLPAHVVASALTQLELGGNIRFRDFASHPV